MTMELLTKYDLKPLFIARPDQRDYTLKRYFHPWQKFPYLARFKIVLKLLGEEKFDNFLDAGFGSGIFIPELKKITQNLYGIDLHPEVDLVKKIINNKRIPVNLQKADLTNLPFPENFFDGILCLSVLEFVSDIEKAISEMKRVTKPGATIIIGVPVLNPLTNFIYTRVVKFKNHLLAHKTSQQEVLTEINKYLKIAQIVRYPFWLPGRYSLFLVIKAKKSFN